ncbi:glucuronyl hydrolase [Sphingobacterium sp. SGG-5]|uniref:glycoside hydrolase family 88 protein n=1 Tax=Sphingobacterium sp. SGG-5 TaxID=2710881 RepID=UPI0013EC50A3|nr:glycoside hydrolase family 88 protein [Sphingobacterium sp. SGG-5]NGM62503.1 glucuronyl hydrolase [Sphingobacterium sp. SGG-5]
MRKIHFVFVALVYSAFGTLALAQHKFQLSKEFIQANLDQAAKQIEVLAAATPKDKFPKTFEKNQQKFSSSSWWCSGFYPGTLWYLYEGTQKAELRKLAEDKLVYLEKEKNNKGTHDLGFMLFCSFGNRLRLTGNAEYKPVLVAGAESLSSRYSDKTKAIRSWDHKPWHYPVIIDNMMNLEFLTQLSKLTGDKKYYNIAVTHAETTLKNHFRKDYSSYHVIDYDSNTGKVIAKKTHQGAADESAWARGQGWALYGYTMMYRETGKKAFLKQARHIAKFILNHPNLPADMIPYWDFDMDKIPSTSKMYANRTLRDVSAAALYASALLELAQYTKGKESLRFFSAAETIIKNLSEPPYKAAYGDNGGYILKHSVGALPLNSEVDVPLTYADYYYVEALVRYKRLLEEEPVVPQNPL